MATSDEIIEQAEFELAGQVSVGDIVGHRDHRLAHTLIDIVGDIGICTLPSGEQRMWPVAELFDVNKVRDRAVELAVASVRRRLDRVCRSN